MTRDNQATQYFAFDRTGRDDSARDFSPTIFNDGRGDDDAIMRDDSLDCYSLSIDVLTI